MKVYAKTDIGNCREENQDNYWVGELDNSAIAVVLCDGMGGQNAGGCASSTTVEFIKERLIKGFRAFITRNKIRNLLITSVTAANSVVSDLKTSDPEKTGERPAPLPVINSIFTARPRSDRNPRRSGGRPRQRRRRPLHP